MLWSNVLSAVHGLVESVGVEDFDSSESTTGTASWWTTVVGFGADANWESWSAGIVTGWATAWWAFFAGSTTLSAFNGSLVSVGVENRDWLRSDSSTWFTAFWSTASFWIITSTIGPAINAWEVADWFAAFWWAFLTIASSLLLSVGLLSNWSDLSLGWSTTFGSASSIWIVATTVSPTVDAWEVADWFAAFWWAFFAISSSLLLSVGGLSNWSHLSLWWGTTFWGASSIWIVAATVGPAVNAWEVADWFATFWWALFAITASLSVKGFLGCCGGSLLGKVGVVVGCGGVGKGADKAHKH
jgi:hypothetical protein